MKVSSKVKKLFMPLVAVAVLAGCYNDKADQLYPEPPVNPNTCDTANVSYTNTVKPIIKQYCTDPNCHIGGGTTGAYLLNTYDGLKVPVTNNRLLGAINHMNGFVAMPQGMAKLSACDISKITAWVNQGALNN